MGVQIHAKEARRFGETNHIKRQIRRAQMTLSERRQRRAELRLTTGKKVRCPACKQTAEGAYLHSTLTGQPCPDIFHLVHLTENQLRQMH